MYLVSKIFLLFLLSTRLCVAHPSSSFRHSGIFCSVALCLDSNVLEPFLSLQIPLFSHWRLRTSDISFEPHFREGVAYHTLTKLPVSELVQGEVHVSHSSEIWARWHRCFDLIYLMWRSAGGLSDQAIGVTLLIGHKCWTCRVVPGAVGNSLASIFMIAQHSNNNLLFSGDMAPWINRVVDWTVQFFNSCLES